MKQKSLTRDEFREGVFRRDKYQCVICSATAQDAHHILERRLFSDGGYHLDNGASLCGPHHIEAEQTTISCDQIRSAAGITSIVLPLHLYHDQPYDKWGNPILPNGQRMRGELFNDESVQKILAPVLHLFTDRVKYPRTWHLPFSPGVGKDDRVLADLELLRSHEIIITEKMDGENTTLGGDYLHARSTEYAPHESRNWVRALHGSMCGEIPQGWRVCGENLYAQHSIAYVVPDYFMAFSVWDDKNWCLSWDDAQEWFSMLGLTSVPLLYRGPWCDKKIEELVSGLDTERQEGFVIRTAEGFHYKDFCVRVAKYVRASHVQTHGGWLRQAVRPNTLA